MTPRFFLVLLPVLGALALSGCTTMSPAECKTANWYDVGLRDGLAGERLAELDARTKSCAEVGVQADATRYLQGRNQGLQSYCRMDNAVRLGLEGKAYHGVCVPAMDAEFRRRHEIGREVYQARSQLRSQDSRRRSLEDKLRDAASDDDRRKLREELSDLDRSLRRTRERLRDAERALDRLR